MTNNYIKAEVSLKRTVIYTDDSGQFFRYSGGTWAWRNHNPGNLYPGPLAKRHNQIGSTGKFAIFSSYDDGHSALLDCLQTTYKNASIDNLVKDYAPAKDGNNIKVYRKFLHDQTGVMDDKKVKDFTPIEFDNLWRAIEKIEGYKEGTIIEVFQITQVLKNKSGIYKYNVKKKGWLSTTECMKLTKNGQLDLVISTSRLGHKYLKARPHSSINKSLDSLVIKNKKRKK